MSHFHWLFYGLSAFLLALSSILSRAAQLVAFAVRANNKNGRHTASFQKSATQGRAWKSMEALPMKGARRHEWIERWLSLPSSPTPASVLLQSAAIKVPEASTERENCEELSSLKRDKEVQENSCVSIVSDGASIAELGLESTQCGPHEVEHPLRQKDIEASTHTLGSVEEVNQMEQEILTHVKYHDGAELPETFACISNELHDTEEHCSALSLEACSQISTIAKEMEGTEHTSEDIEHVSQINNIDCQETHSYLSTPPKRADDAKHTTQTKETFMRTTGIEVSLYEHLQQDHTGREEASTYDFIMHRFLPAAQEIAAMEHESSVAFIASKNQAAGVCPSPPKPQRPPIVHRVKTRTHRAARGFTSARSFHGTQKDDGMSHSIKSCGFFCLGLKSALFRAHRTVSAARRKSWGSHASPVKVADEGSSFISSTKKGETEAMEGLSNASHMYSPSRTSAKLDATPRRHAMKCHLIGGASKRQEEAVAEGMVMHNFISACDCNNAESFPVHNLESASMIESPQQIVEGDMHVKSSLSQDQAWQVGDGNEDGESQFFDALSRLNSVKSNASFYTFGSPRSQCESLGFQNEGGMKEEIGFADAVSQFGTPQAVLSEDNSVLSHKNGEPLSLSQRFGKILKLETCEQSGLNFKHIHSEEGSVLKEGDQQAESFSRMRHGSLDSVYPLNPGTVSPIFPAKCQSSSSLGWPLGISTYQTSRMESSAAHIHPDKRIKEYTPGLNVLSPPLPPCPKGSWLGKAISKNASTTSPLSTLQQKSKVASARKKLDFLDISANAERRWEDVVKGSQAQTGHLRFSEELHQRHPLNHNRIQPLKL